jgi:hypothetical protein
MQAAYDYVIVDVVVNNMIGWDTKSDANVGVKIAMVTPFGRGFGLAGKALRHTAD